MSLRELVEGKARAARRAADALALCSTRVKDEALTQMARALEEKSAVLLDANRRDLERGRTKGLTRAFMDRLTEVAGRCSTVGRPVPFDPPPGAERALRITTGKRDAVWVSAGDFVVKVDVAFGAGGDVEVDDALAPRVVAEAVAKARPGGS